jgi:hypothetical protein
MKPYLILASVLVVIGHVGQSQAQSSARPVFDPALEKKIDSVLPSQEEERWLQIPWRTDLSQALTDARRSGKPVLLWVMNGNPLGCA